MPLANYLSGPTSRTGLNVKAESGLEDEDTLPGVMWPNVPARDDH
jgi:hypothetical protein